MIIWIACSCPMNWLKKDMIIKSRVGRGKIMKNVRAAARIGASCSQRLKAAFKRLYNSFLFIEKPIFQKVWRFL
jgi:hypothetical protein